MSSPMAWHQSRRQRHRDDGGPSQGWSRVGPLASRSAIRRPGRPTGRYTSGASRSSGAELGSADAPKKSGSRSRPVSDVGGERAVPGADLPQGALLHTPRECPPVAVLGARRSEIQPGRGLDTSSVVMGVALFGEGSSTGDRYVWPSVVDAVGRESHVVPLAGGLPTTPCSEADVTSGPLLSQV